MDRAPRAAVLAPDDGAAQARLIALLDASGDRAGALEVSERFARRPRNDYAVELAPETRILIERIRSRTAPHLPTAGLGDGTPAQGAESASHSEPHTRPRRGTLSPRVSSPRSGRLRWRLSRGMVVAARSSPTPPLDQNLVAVLPFGVAGLDSTYGEGMVDLLSATLTGEGGPRAVSPQLVVHGWARARPPAEGPQRLARTLGAGRVVQGSIVRRPEGWWCTRSCSGCRAATT
jgi:hypothetical protein